MLRGEYVHILSLLHREVLPDSKLGQSNRGNEMPKRARIARTWENWEIAFLIYVGVIAEAYPDRSPTLIKYMGIIRLAYNTLRNMAWFNYDKQFRLRQPHKLRSGGTYHIILCGWSE